MKLSFAERLRAISKRVGGAAALAQMTGIPKRSIDAYIGGESDVPSERLRLIIEATKVDPAWLLFGEGDEPGAIASTPYATRSTTVLTTDGESPRHEARDNFDDFVKLPLYDITASAGSGAWNDSARIKSHLAFRRDWLHSLGVNPESDELGLVSASGDSMPRSAPNGAVVMIQSLRFASMFNEGVSLMLLNGMHVIKYVQRIGMRPVS